VGAPVRVHALRYTLALYRGGERRAGLWEVGAVEGLAPDEFEPQRELYHITDTAALVGVAPREVPELLTAARMGQLGAEWSVESFPLSPECEQVGWVSVDAVITVS